MITVTPLPAFIDNYLWLLEHEGHAVVVDPGDASVVLAGLSERALKLAAILVTHHHPDHVGGLAALTAAFDVPVYGPRAEAAKIKGLTVLLEGGDRVEIPALAASFEVIAVPGHTLGHIAYFNAAQKLLFCGDTLFVAGCGRLFEGTAAQMHTSLTRLAALPPETAVYCAHEYTLSNLDFATAVEPDNPALAAEVERVKGLRAAGIPSVPSSIAGECALNPFLRSAEPALAKAAELHAGRALNDAVEVFAELRRWKDDHRVRSF